MKINKEIFFKNLALTQNYCEERIEDESKSTAKVLRSLNFSHQNKLVFEFEWNEPWGEEDKIEVVKWNFDVTDDDHKMLQELFDLQLAQKKQDVFENNKDVYNGNILVAELQSITDGGSEMESNGLIDIYDLPPIDTWFYLAKNGAAFCMLAWIPEKFEDEIEGAIDVNIVDLFTWLEYWDTELYKAYQKSKH